MSETDGRWYELRNLVYAGDFDAARSLVDSQPEILEFRNGIGETVLHFLAVEKDLDGVAWLHAQGSDLHTKNEFGTPVLFEVAQLDYQELYEWFITKGVDVHARDADGNDLSAYLKQFAGQDS
jgi:hypothetical protein